MVTITFIPDNKDFDYFMEYYGKNGVFDNVHLNSTTFIEFRNACISFQDKSGASWQEFGSIEREQVRDQLLFDLGHEPIGYIYSPTDQWFGIEHLQKSFTQQEGA